LAPFLLMRIERPSPCKVNLLLNILGRRADGFHELETVMHPVPVHDLLDLELEGTEVRLTCNDPRLPLNRGNLVYRAAAAFLETAGIPDGVRIHLEKRIPLAAGLGGGSGNAATTLLGLNELFGQPLAAARLATLAASLGSDVPFFLQTRPALATGRGEQVLPLDFFPAFRGVSILLLHPGFGVSTPWAYQNLARFPEALHGRVGRAGELIRQLEGDDLAPAGAAFYNSLEAPVLDKYAVLALYQDFLRNHGATMALMSGSGSTTFALVKGQAAAEALAERVKETFGPVWTAVVPL